MKIIRPITTTDSVLVSSSVTEADYTAYSATKVYSTGEIIQYVTTDIHKVYKSLVGSTSVVTMTIATPCVVSWTAHTLAANTPISFTTTGALPTGLVAGTVYYVLTPLADSFNVSATPGGAAITTTGTQSGVHTAVGSANYAVTPGTAPTTWLDMGATNRWKMFDSSLTSQTSKTDSIIVELSSPNRIDSIALMNVSARTANVTVTDTIDGVVYDRTITLISDSDITDWWSYFYESTAIGTTDVTFTDLPLYYTNATITITLSNAGTTVLCGCCVIGQAKDVGTVEMGVKVGIQDYSVKAQDAFGNYSVQQRAFRKTQNLTLWLDSDEVNSTYQLLASYRAQPIVYIVSEDYTATLIYGFYKDFSIDIAYATKSVCSLSLEGLT